MAANKKEYTLVINGVSENIKDVTTLTDRVKELDGELGKAHGINTKATAASRERSKALTEEEKAGRKLKETIGKVAQAKSEQNRQQIEANQALRDATREATLRARAENAAEGSIEQMRAKLALLNSEWKNLDVGSEAFQEISAEILQLNEDIKRAEESTGDFRRSVGNYEKATAGLETFGKGLSGVTQIGKGLTGVFLSANSILGLFGDRSEEDAKQAQQLQKILALLSLVQSANNSLLKDGIVLKAKSAALDKVQAVQIEAKAAAEAAATKNTIAATAAQKIYNAVASANPYVLLALAILSVAGAAVIFSRDTTSAAGKAKKYKSSVDDLTFSTKEARDAHEGLKREIRDIQIEIDLATGKISEYEAALQRITNKGADAVDELDRKYQESRDAVIESSSGLWAAFLRTINPFSKNVDQIFADLDKQREEWLENRTARQEANNKEIEAENARHNKNILDQNEDLNNENLGGIAATLAQIETSRRRQLEQAEADNKKIADLNKKRSKSEQLAFNDLNAINKKYDKERIEAIQSLTNIEVEVIRQSEDAKTKTIRDANEQARQQTAAQYDRQIEDIRRRLATETNLTTTLNATIESLETQKDQALADLQKEQDAKLLELQRKAEDASIALILDSNLRRRAEVQTEYERNIADLNKQLTEIQEQIKCNTDGQTAELEAQAQAVTDIIARTEAQFQRDMQGLISDEMDRTSELALSSAELFADQWQQRIGDLIVRNKDSEFNLIDVEATRKNLDAANMYLTQYIGMVQSAQKQETDAHNERLKGLKKGTPKYEGEMQRYGRAMLGFAQKVDEAQDQIKRNTETSTNILLENYEKVAQKVQEIGQAVIQAASITSEAIQNEVQYKIDALNAQLDALDERYQKTVEANEAHKDRIKEIEAELQDATGGTAEALRAQLEDQMHAQAEAAREEARLAKEKERIQKEIDKKEKQMKRAQLVSDITQGIANTASAVIGALGNKPWGPWNFALAAIVGAMGAAQTGIMTRQLTKLADGGLIVGPSHAKGGARIHGTNIEVEGGEFVVNKASYAANAGLVRYINDARGPISSGEAMGFMPKETTPVPINLPPLFDADDIIEAIHGIDIRPVVSVVDIADVSDQVTRVRDIAGA